MEIDCIQILVIEDNPTDLQSLHDALSNESVLSFQLTTTGSLAGGLRLAEQQLFDLIILDLDTASTAGIEWLQRIHNLNPDLPVIALAADLGGQIKSLALQNGAQDFLLKSQTGWASLGQAARYAVACQQSQARMMASEQQIFALFEHSADAVALIDADGLILFESPTASRIFGYPTDHMLGESIFDKIHPEDLPAARQSLTLVNQRPDGPLTMKLRYQHQDGHWLWIEATVTNMLAERGVQAIVINYRDMTTRHQIEEALRESEERYRRMFEDHNLAMMLLDPDTGQIIDANPAAEKFYGYPRNLLQGMTIEDINTNPPEQVADALRKTIEEGHGHFTSEHRLASGETRTVEVHSSPIPFHNKTILFSIIHDITDRNRTEIERQALLEIMQGLVVTEDLPEYLKLVHHSISRIIYAENFLVILLNQETGLFEEAYVADQFDPPSPPFMLERSLSAYVYRTEKPILINDTLFKSLSNRGEVELVGTDSPSWLGVPLKTPKGTIGVMVVQDYEDSNRYSPRDVDFMTSIASQVALAVERKRSDAAMARLSRQMESILSSAGEGIYGTDIDGMINFTNPAFAQMVGWTSSEMFGKSMHNLCHHTHADKTPYPQQDCPLYLATLEGKSMHTDDEIFWRRDGTSFPVELTSMPLREGSQVIGTVVVVKDITQRRAAEIASLRWAARAELLASMPELFAAPDADYHESFDLLARRISTLIGYPCAINLEGEAGAALTARTFTDETQDQIARAPEVPTWNLPMRVQGKVIGSFNLASPAGFSNREEDLPFLQEIADRTALAFENARLLDQVQRQNAELERRVSERTSDLIRVNAELESAARAKDEFLASMSHELRTPLNAILTLTESLEEGIYGNATEPQIKPLRTISESGHHLLNLINDILDLSKIQAGKISIDLAPVDIDMVCQASLRLINQQAQKKNLQVSFQMDPAVTLMEVDGRLLKQMLVNLLSNAVKFTSPHGQIGLEVHSDPAQGIAHFTVWDTGIGIPPEYMHLLFQPFVQIDTGLARQYGGTGLGLALVYRMAELHGGSVSLESTPGKGSRFTISLPWHALAVSAVPPEPPRGQVREQPGGFQAGKAAPSRFHTGRLFLPDSGPLILIAEDNPSNQDIYADYLKAKGYRVLLASNGLEALERARQGHPDLVIMDIQMPTMDGLEAIRRMRADTQLQRIPVIALTALAMPEDRERCMAAGAADYLTKPVSLKLLLSLIGNYSRTGLP